METEKRVFMKNVLKKLIFTGAAIALYGLFSGCKNMSVVYQIVSPTPTVSVVYETVKEAFNAPEIIDLDKIEILKPIGLGTLTVRYQDIGTPSLHTRRQRDAINDGYRKILNHAFGTDEFSFPNPVVHKWAAKTKKEEEPVKFVFELADNEKMENPLVIETTETVLPVYNLMLDKDYYWRISCEMADGTKFDWLTAQTYRTDAEAPRNLKIDGVTNCRDIGGWTASNGKKVKQGMAYRTGRLNEDESETITIQKEGIDWLLNTAKIKTEIDFRVGEIRNTSALGDSVKYINIAMPGSVVSQLRQYDAQIAEIIRMFADENNYPILFHCSLGTDRTGLITFLINGLLGVSEDDLYMDYVFSNMGEIGALRKADEIKESYVSVIGNFPGNNLSEQISNYLLEIGLKESELNNIRSILLEK